MSLTAIYFDNINYFKDILPKESIDILNQEINRIEKNFDNLIADNNRLSGNIAKEYYFDQPASDKIETILLPYATSYFQTNRKIFTKHGKIKLDSVWVNFQSKYEFNPVHTHSGDISFVIWVKIPYYHSEELKNESVMYSNNPLPGCFQFMYTDILGCIQTATITCDKTLERTMLMFPSKLNHMVYPFYTSDDHRISISGNFSIE
jgi:hypothetical protein